MYIICKKDKKTQKPWYKNGSHNNNIIYTI